MRKALAVSCAATFVTALGLTPVLGQNVTGEGSAQSGVLTMTCGSLTALDSEMSTGVIHYIAGYSDGQRAVLAASGPADVQTESGEVGETEDTSNAGGGQTTPTETAASEEPTASVDASSGTAADMSDGGANGSTAGLGISVDQVLAACAEAPDSPASEVINVARGASQPEIDPQDEDPAAEGEEGQDVGSGNAVVE